MGANTENPDTIVYENMYNRETFFSKDVGFGLVIWIFKYFKIPYIYLKLAVAAIGLILINKTVEKYVNDSKLYYVLYFIYPFVFDVVQVRNFLAMSIFIYAIPCLLDNSKKANVKYILLILLASSMQKTALVYIPIAFIKNLSFNKRKNLFLNIVIITSIVIGICRPLLYNFTEMLMAYLSDALTGLEKQLDIITNWGWILDWSVQFCNFILIKLVKDKISNEEGEHKKEISEKVKLIECVFVINYYLFAFLPLYVITPTFNRIMRNILPLNFLCYNIFIENIISKKSKVLFTYITVIYTCFMFFIYIVYSGPYWDTILKMIFTHNWIFNL